MNSTLSGLILLSHPMNKVLRMKVLQAGCKLRRNIFDAVPARGHDCIRSSLGWSGSDLPCALLYCLRITRCRTRQSFSPSIAVRFSRTRTSERSRSARSKT